MSQRGVFDPLMAPRLGLLDGIAAGGTGLPPAELAERFAAWGAPYGPASTAPIDVDDQVTDGSAWPVPVRVYAPVTPGRDRVGLVWAHGGAFVGGDLDMPEADQVARGLVARTGAVVVSVDYRRAVDGIHFPVPRDDVRTAYNWTIDHADALGLDPRRVALGGASAGGNLAASVALGLRDDGRPPWRLLLAYPVLHAVLPEPSAELLRCLEQTPPALRFPPELMTWMNTNYVGGPSEQAGPEAFPALAADLTGFPPTYLEHSEFDDLRSSGEAFAPALGAAGVEVTEHVAAGVPHGHLNLVGHPVTEDALDRIADWLR